jgi:hydroxymethylglutaryl-CoA synthase
MNGIVSYGVHLPYWRLDRSKITQALGQGGGRGTRSVASFDEDATSMGVEAGRRALAAAAPGYGGPGILAYATTAPGYLDKTNATAIHAALRLDDCVPAFDVGGAAKSGTAATIMAHNGGIAVLSDVRTGRPGSADEAAGGDAAVALIFGDDAVIAEPVGYAPVTAEFVDRWRVPGESYSRQWEERFGEHAYVPLATQAVGDVLKQADVQIGDVDHAIVAGLHTRSVKAVSKQLGCAPERLADDLLDTIGNTGTAHWALMLANVLDQASPGDLVLVAHLADGCDASLLRVTDEIVAFRERQRSTVAEQLAATTTELDYPSFMTWRGFLEREPPRRPEPDRPASPPSLRGNAWKYGFVGAQDDGGFIHLPPGRVSVESGAIDEMTPVPMADRRATIATFTIDRLAYSLAPPVVAAIVDFDGGGRMQVELTDVDPAEVKIGDRVEMTFRRLYTVDGIHNHFWKARPVRS